MNFLPILCNLYLKIMKLNTLLFLNAIFSLLNAIGAIFMPAFILNIYGVAQGKNVELMAQYAGIGSVAIGLLAYFATKIEPSDAKRYIVLSIFISDVIGVIISIYGTLKGIMSLAGWSLVIVYLFFVLGYGYYLFVKNDLTSQS